ncbi:MAG: THxN family PEP-CTERM protein [Desulfobacterales bacterium]|nr:THxN family PEP-CTERM protein [Desulfobacterales bacterium]
MKKILIFLYVIGICIGTAWSVNALTLSSVDGDWTGATGGLYVNYRDGVAVNYGNGLEDQIRWGRPASGNGQSGLGFTGSASYGSPLTFDSGEAFSIGQLRHFNNPIRSGSAASEAFLDISMSFSDPDGLDNVFDFTLGIDETPNTSDPEESADHISISDGSMTQVFEYAGIQYTFELLGFGETADDLVSSFTSYEGGTNDTELWGKITASNPVPEPTTMLLFGFGLLGFANVARRKLS